MSAPPLAPRLGRQNAFIVRPDHRFNIPGAWWTGVILQQAFEAVARNLDAEPREA